MYDFAQIKSLNFMYSLQNALPLTPQCRGGSRAQSTSTESPDSRGPPRSGDHGGDAHKRKLHLSGRARVDPGDGLDHIGGRNRTGTLNRYEKRKGKGRCCSGLRALST